MRLLLDTHVILWALSANPRLGRQARSRIVEPSNEVFASAASAWEIAIKRSIGKLEAPADLEAELEREGIDPLVIRIDHALAVGGLPPHHRDPFDRMLAAQSLLESLTMVTADPVFEQYGVTVLDARV